MSTTDPHPPAARQPPVPPTEDIFGDPAPLRSAEDLAHAGTFDDGEAEEFIVDLYAMRPPVLQFSIDPLARADASPVVR